MTNLRLGAHLGMGGGWTQPPLSNQPCNQITAANPSVNSSPMTESMVSLVDQVFIVSATLMLKYSFTSQNPPSLTWEKMSAPAPVAMASNSGRTPGLCSRMVPTMVADA